MQVQNLSFQHTKSAPHFFKALSFALEKGKLHALHGKNGMGKSLLLRLLGNHPFPEAVVSGEIAGREAAFLMQQKFDLMLADQFTFTENLRFAAMGRYPHPFKGLPSGISSDEFMAKFHIPMHTPVYKLSGGQRQILALLMAVQQQRHILLLDEPTATLDGQNALMVFDFLQILAGQGVTLLVVCHDGELVGSYTTGAHLHLHLQADGLRTLTQK